MKRSSTGMRPNSPAYVSDFEKFMGDFMRSHPEVEPDQKRGWYIWWDHHVDPDQLEQQRQDSVPFKPYL